MKSAKLVLSMIALVLVIAGIVPFLTGCGKSFDVDTTGMCLVVYEGNGGYLGNKTATVRKMYCEPGSKIPDYPVEYVKDNQYTVSSLGLAMREGYNLMGWYLSDEAEYRESENGEYVFLRAEDGNGIYEIDPNGEYVRKYEIADGGEYIFVYVEESTEDGDTYVFIDASAGKGKEDETDNEEAEDTATEETDEEETVALSVDSGFYVCNGETTLAEIDDDNLREAYRAAYEEKTYTKAQVAELSGWQKLDDLAAANRELFKNLDTYNYVYATATEEDEGLEHYAVVSGYASLYSIFVEDEGGAYAYLNSTYVPYDSENEAHAKAQRYSMSDKYIFNPTEDIASPSALPRYEATMSYWDFANDTVTEDKCVWDGEKYILTLNAHWVKKNTVYYHYDNLLDQVDESWTRLLTDNITYVPIRPGEVIGRKEIVPKNAGQTFVCWTKTKGEFDPWDFEHDVFPEGETELHLYGYYIDGEYTRVVSASGLQSIGKNPDGKYVLVNNVDFGGKKFTSSPLGLKNDQVFTGEFLAFNNTISNFTYDLSPSKQQAFDSSIISVGALFPQTQGAHIDGLNVECSAVFSGLNTASKGAKKNINFMAAGIVGKVVNGANTEITNCNVKISFAEKSEGALKSDSYNYVIRFGGIAADVGYSLKTSGCSAEVENALDTSYITALEHAD